MVLAFGTAFAHSSGNFTAVGWDIETRKKNLHLIVNNSRFLVLPWVRSKNLASRILSLISKRIGADWQERYNYEPVLLETFVEKGRFQGNCYKAANWTYVGDTKGRGKLDVHYEHKLPVKGVWLYPLRKAEPNSGLGKAILYMLKHWNPLTLFLGYKTAH